MNTLLLRLAGPHQSWGDSSRFFIRETQRHPSKSGVIGLLCAALGWDRDAPTFAMPSGEIALDQLSQLNMGVRVIREGVVERDFHTVSQVLRAKAKLGSRRGFSTSNLQPTVVTERYFLSDAYFLVGIESAHLDWLVTIDNALQNPYWPLSLGRKSFAPSLPVSFTTASADRRGVLSGGVVDVLSQVRDVFLPKDSPTQRLVLDANLTPPAQDWILTLEEQQQDVPVSFSPRRFISRTVHTYFPCSYVPFSSNS